MNRFFFRGLIAILSISLISCQIKKEEPIKINKEKELPISKGDSIINKAIKAHGGELYDTANYSFVFRGNEYSLRNTENSYRYSVKRKIKDEIVEDILSNGLATRKVNGKDVTLDSKTKSRYSEALNSVIYFALLPYKLNDAAVNKKYKGEVTINKIAYHVVEVTFNQEGGGKDFEDQFYYWINKNSNTLDYLAYNYKVNNGGVRFRSSYNRRAVDGIIFQDYVNYKAEVGTPLSELPKLFEENKLKELSKIVTEDVQNLKSN